MRRGPRCSRCGSRDLLLSEITETAGTIEQAGGRLVGLDGPDCRDLIFVPGLVSRVDAECKRCGHGWKTRLRQITDHPDYEVDGEDGSLG